MMRRIPGTDLDVFPLCLVAGRHPPATRARQGGGAIPCPQIASPAPRLLRGVSCAAAGA